MSIEDQFDAIGAATLNDYILTGQGENLTLDFKTVSRPDLANRDDRKNLAIALSGFANSDGGLIVWGITTQKTNGVDCAAAKSEIGPLSRFMGRLNQLTPEAASPAIDGVRHKGISSAADQGFAVTLVPRSDSGPHMAKLGEDRYYKRSGDSFRRLEHFDLEDMFGRRPKPLLDLVSSYVRIATQVDIILSLQNNGRGPARAPYLAFEMPFGSNLSNTRGVDGRGHFGLPRLPSRYPREAYGASADFVIHPNTTHPVTAITIESDPQKHVPTPATIEVRAEIAALGSPLFRTTVTIDWTDLRKVVYG
jgi:hypothetical protein